MVFVNQRMILFPFNKSLKFEQISFNSNKLYALNQSDIYQFEELHSLTQIASLKEQPDPLFMTRLLPEPIRRHFVKQIYKIRLLNPEKEGFLSVAFSNDFVLIFKKSIK